MEFHSEALNCLCRLCGGPLLKYSHNKHKLIRKIEKVLEIDVSSDEKLIQSVRQMQTAATEVLQRETNTQTNNNKLFSLIFIGLPIQKFIRCLRIILSRTVMNLIATSQNAHISKCSYIFVKHGYMKTNPQNGVLMSYVMVIYGAERIHSCVKVF